jgi:DNA-binding PadR family transcriptional regulator
MHEKFEKAAHRRRGIGGFGRFAAVAKGRLVNSDELQLLTLHLLSERPRHGYEIIKSVEELSSGVYAPSPGMVYPVLTYIEELSYAVSEADGAKKLFRITDAGAAFLAENRERLSEVLNRIEFIGRKMASMQREMAQDEMADERWGLTATDRATFHDLRREFKTALFEKLSASPEEKARVLGILRDAIDKIRNN